MDKNVLLAFGRLFGKAGNPSQADVDLVKEIYLDPDTQDELAAQNAEAANNLCEFCDDAIASIVMADDISEAHKSLLRNLAGIPEPRNEPTKTAASTRGFIPQPKIQTPPAPQNNDDADDGADEEEDEDDHRPIIVERGNVVHQEPLTEDSVAHHNRGKGPWQPPQPQAGQPADGDGGQSQPAQPPVPKPPINREPKFRFVHTPATTALLGTKLWHDMRTKIEALTGKLELKLWVNYMERYKAGHYGHDKILFGTRMLDLIDQINKGMDPNSPEYKYAYVDPTTRLPSPK